MVCICPEGYVTDQNGGCKTLPPIVSGCERDDECNDQTACINAVCRDPCGCGLNARCDIVEHRPVCVCEPGFYGKILLIDLFTLLRRNSQKVPYFFWNYYVDEKLNKILLAHDVRVFRFILE